MPMNLRSFEPILGYFGDAVLCFTSRALRSSSPTWQTQIFERQVSKGDTAVTQPDFGRPGSLGHCMKHADVAGH